MRGWSFWPGAPTDQNGPVAALSTTDVWVVGQAASNDHGTVAHWDGSAWSSQTLPGLASVDAVAAGDASNVWAGGGGQIDHYDGASWSTQTTPSPGSDDALTDIAASSASNAWAVGSYDVTGAGGAIQHLPLPLQYNGTTWSLQPAVIPGTDTDTVFTAVATLSSTDVWAVGRTSADAFSPTEPLVEHWNGTSWSVSFLPTTGFDGGALTDVYEASPTNVWAIGSDGTTGLVEHWNGTKWVRLMPPDLPGGSPTYTAVGGLGGGNIWIGGFEQLSGGGGVEGRCAWHWSGGVWTITRTPAFDGTYTDRSITSLAVVIGAAYGQVGPAMNGYGMLVRYGSAALTSQITNLQAADIDVGGTAQITGTLAFSAQATSWGETVHVERTNTDESQTALPDVTVGNDGTFSISDTPPSIRGPYTYTVTFDGDGAFPATQAQVSINVRGNQATVTLTPSAATIRYQHTVTLTAQLSAFATNNVITIDRLGANGPVQVASGPVGADGTLTATVTLSKDATFQAFYAGDDEFEPGESSQETVDVRVLITGAESGYYGHRGKYKLYHFTSSCPKRHRRCPVYTETFKPNKTGDRGAGYTLEEHTRHGWKLAARAEPRIGRHSRATIVLLYRDSTRIIGRKFRERGSYAGDSENAGNIGSWSYFELTR